MHMALQPRGWLPAVKPFGSGRLMRRSIPPDLQPNGHPPQGLRILMKGSEEFCRFASLFLVALDASSVHSSMFWLIRLFHILLRTWRQCQSSATHRLWAGAVLHWTCSRQDGTFFSPLFRLPHNQRNNASLKKALGPSGHVRQFQRIYTCNIHAKSYKQWNQGLNPY